MKRAVGLFTSIAIVAAAASSAAAGSITVPLSYLGVDSGWSITIPDEVSAGVYVDALRKSGPQDQWYVTLQISKTYRQPDCGGPPEPIRLYFTQTGTDAATVPQIRIAEEAVANLSGTTWSGFQWVLHKNGFASFNEAATSIYTGQGYLPGVFEITPFTQYAWSEDAQTETLSVFGGLLPSPGLWNPGYPSGGYLQIDVLLGGAPSGFQFELEEAPMIPEPLTILGFVTAAGLVLRRMLEIWRAA